MRVFVGIVLALVLLAGAGAVLPSTSLVRFLAPSVDLGDAAVLKEVRHTPEKPAEFDHSAFSKLLAAHADSESGRVDYAGLKKEKTKLDAYLKTIAAVDLKTLSPDTKLALLINAYNGYTLELILAHYPGLKSIKDIKKPWKSKKYVVGGHTLSLDDIEHGLIRPVYKDSRIHFAVNCASIGCPPLQSFAFEGDKIDAQLDLAARRTLRDAQYVRVEGDKLKMTTLLNWYGDDFIGEDYSPRSKTLARYVARFGTKEVRAFVDKHKGAPSVGYIDYDWALNDMKSK